MEDIRSVEQDRLWKLECKMRGQPMSAWMPVTIGSGEIVCSESKEDADRLITQFVKKHTDRNIPVPKIPLFRARLMSVEETKEVRKHLLRRGQQDGGKYGTDVRRTTPPKLGETYHAG